ncbi:hypothetical protein Q4R37_19770, partial [Morganella morganii]
QSDTEKLALTAQLAEQGSKSAKQSAELKKSLDGLTAEKAALEKQISALTADKNSASAKNTELLNAKT